MKPCPIYIASCLSALACNSADGQYEDLAPSAVSAPSAVEPGAPHVDVGDPDQSAVASGGSGTSAEVPTPTSTLLQDDLAAGGGSGNGGSSSGGSASTGGTTQDPPQADPNPPETTTESEFHPDFPSGYSAGTLGPPQAEGVRFVEFEVRDVEKLVARISPGVTMEGGVGRLLEGQSPGPMPELCFAALQYPPAGDRSEDFEWGAITKLLGIAFRISSAPESGTRFVLVGNYNNTGEEWAFAGPGMKVALFQSGLLVGDPVPTSDAWPNVINALAWEAIPIESEVCISEIYVIVDDSQ